MGRRGPSPKPTALRVIQGNPGKRPLNQNEPKPLPIAPKCPPWLDTEARREWKRVAPELERLGLLTVVDGAALAAYCQAYSNMVQARRVLRKEGLTIEYTNKAGATNTIPHPMLKVEQDSARLVKTFCAEFGLTPSSRSRMSLPNEKGDVDPFEEYLNRGKRSG